jgi:type II secretion system protein H
VLARSHSLSGEHGFTLIELLSCIVIAGILATMASQQFIGDTAFSERGYVDEIASALRQSQKISIASACNVSVTIDAAGYRAFQRAASGTTCAAAGAYTLAVKRIDGTALNAATPADVASSPAIQVIFDQNGNVAGAVPPLTVGPYTLNVQTGSGFVQVQ